MRDGRLELQKAIKALVDTALPAAPMYVSLESCTSLPYTLFSSDTLNIGPDKDNGNSITFTLIPWASSLTEARQNTSTIIRNLTDAGLYTIDPPFSVDAVSLDQSDGRLEDPLPDGSTAWAVPVRLRYILSYT